MHSSQGGLVRPLRAQTIRLAAAALLGALAFVGHVRSGERGEGLSLSLAGEAHATTSVAMTLDELVERSPRVVIGQAVEHQSQWEELGGTKRIVTYTRVIVEETVYGAHEDEIWVRTLGGVVDKVGQAVAGEAQLKIGETAVLFLADVPGALVVTGMAQGHYPLDLGANQAADDRTLKASPDPGTLLRRASKSGAPSPKSAIEELVGGSVASARKKIVAARQALKK
ncbi:MAG: hypothetical protein U0271_47160 [Polyangiaceae bacterium]